MQLSYGEEKAVAILGALADSRYKHTDSRIASEAVKAGRFVMKVPGTDNQVRQTQANYNTLTASTDLSASNSTVVTINGVASTAVVYGSSHAATMAALVTMLLTNAEVARCWLDTTDNKIVHVVTFDAVATISAATTGGSAVTWAAGTAGILQGDVYGVAQLTQRLAINDANVDNDAIYPVESLVNVLRQGAIAVYFETAFNPERDTLYVRHTVNGATVVGDLRNTSDTNRATSLSGLPIKVLTTMTAAGIGFIEINLP